MVTPWFNDAGVKCSQRVVPASAGGWSDASWATEDDDLGRSSTAGRGFRNVRVPLALSPVSSRRGCPAFPSSDSTSATRSRWNCSAASSGFHRTERRWVCGQRSAGRSARRTETGVRGERLNWRPHPPRRSSSAAPRACRCPGSAESRRLLRPFAPAGHLSPRPAQRVEELVDHALLQRNDRVVGDPDALRADLSAALGDVAHP